MSATAVPNPSASPDEFLPVSKRLTQNVSPPNEPATPLIRASILQKPGRQPFPRSIA